jgi:DNA-binding beta-propeller fold protein YncE
VSPDGESVYVTGAVSDSVAHFFRDGPDGQISYDDCLANDSSQGCTALPVPVLDGAISVAVSPDSKSVYVASLLSGTVSHFFRGGPAGQISFDGCLASAATAGCVDLPGEPLKGATDVTTSPDGQSVYVASQISESVSHFFRGGPGGQISYDGCLNNDGSSGCADLPANPLRYANGVAVSPDGKSVYASAFESRAVSHMFRAPAPAEPDPVGGPTPDPVGGPTPDPVGDQNPDPVGQPQGDTTAPDTVIQKGPMRKTAKTRARIRFASTEAGSTFECSLDRTQFKPCSSPLRVSKLRPGKHRLAVRAIDSAGNVDQTPATVRWRIKRA